MSFQDKVLMCRDRGKEPLTAGEQSFYAEGLRTSRPDAGTVAQPGRAAPGRGVDGLDTGNRALPAVCSGAAETQSCSADRGQAGTAASASEARKRGGNRPPAGAETYRD